MYSKRYGKTTVRAWLTRELECSHPLVMLLVGLACLLGGILVRSGVGAPYGAILELGIGELIPPAWWMAFLWSVSFFTVGCAAGFVLAYRCGGREGEKYKGVLLFLLLYAGELLWYPTLFLWQRVFLSVLLSILLLCLSVWVSSCFARVTRLSGVILLLHDVWLIYLLLLNVAVLFHA